MFGPITETLSFFPDEQEAANNANKTTGASAPQRNFDTMVLRSPSLLGQRR